MIPAIQRKAAAVAPPEGSAVDAADVAEQGVEGAAAPLPHMERIQPLFGRHDLGGVASQVGGAGTKAARSLGASAYAVQGRVAFASEPDLHTTAHEAAHIIQQRGGVQLKSGLSSVGDDHERHADAVADRIVAGQSAEDLLDQVAGGRAPSAPHPGAVQRRAVLTDRSLWLTGPWLEKKGRLEFDSDLKRAMQLDDDEHRCHVISYDNLSRAVIDPINGYLETRDHKYLGNSLYGILRTIYPNGPTSLIHRTNQDLVEIAKNNYYAAELAMNEIGSICMHASTPPTDDELYDICDRANRMIRALNNSPDNLRPGNSSTNMSLSRHLDMTQDNSQTQLPIGAIIVDVDDQIRPNLNTGRLTTDGNGMLTAPLKVIRVDQQHNRQVRTLLQETYTEDNEVSTFSSGLSLQSSENVRQTSRRMKQGQATPIAIDYGRGRFFVFEC